MALYAHDPKPNPPDLKAQHKDYDYSLRVSPRARRVRLSVKPFVGLEIVVPKNFPTRQIPRILQQHDQWITRQLQKHRQHVEAWRLPEEIELRFLDQRIQVNYQPTTRPGFRQTGSGLAIQEGTNDQVLKTLRDWLRHQARQALTPALHQIADEFGFRFKRTSIRSQKSRWGSCSSSGTISLNDQLLFMPANTVRYLMIHELCHTRHMNHSADFWRLVSSCCPDFRDHEHVLAHGRSLIPDWFLKSLYSR